MTGWKTWFAAAIVGGCAALEYFGYPELADAIMKVGIALGLVGIGHKIQKLKE